MMFCFCMKPPKTIRGSQRQTAAVPFALLRKGSPFRGALASASPATGGSMGGCRTKQHTWHQHFELNGLNGILQNDKQDVVDFFLKEIYFVVVVVVVSISSGSDM